MIAKRRDPALEEFVKKRVDLTVERALAAASDASRATRSGSPSPEASIAYYEATGDRRLLDLSIKGADAADAMYGPGKKGYISGHEGQKIGLIRLFRFTGDERYWKLAKFFIDIRGQEEYQEQSPGEYPGDREYNQNHKPVLEQDEAVGHAVRAMYLYIPLTDIAALTGQPEYAKAADAIWENVVGQKDVPHRRRRLDPPAGKVRRRLRAAERQRLARDLRLLRKRGLEPPAVPAPRDAKYIDTMERILYNGWLVGVSQKGDRFFYQNVLMSYGNYERFDWINVPCCPPNVVRLMARSASYIYAKTAERDLRQPLRRLEGRASSSATRTVKITQETRYPWEGNVKMTVEPEKARREIHDLVRIPEWTQNRPLPSDLYSLPGFDGRETGPQGQRQPRRDQARERATSACSGSGRPATSIELDLPMPVHKVVWPTTVGPGRQGPGRPRARPARLLRRVAGQRRQRPEHRRPRRRRPQGGVPVPTSSTGSASSPERSRPSLGERTGSSIKTVPHNLVAIPYYAWANRGMGEMTVWMARTPEVRLGSNPCFPTRSPRSRTRSRESRRPRRATATRTTTSRAVYDGVDPLSSFDESHLYFRMRPPEKKPAWIEYDFKAPTEVSSSRGLFRRRQRFCRLPGLLARPLQGRKRLETGRQQRALYGRQGQVQPRSPSSR